MADRHWLEWQLLYRFGVLVVLPPPSIAGEIDRIRAEFDPASAGAIGAHLTLTPPFAGEVRRSHESILRDRLRAHSPIELRLGAPTRFAETMVAYLPVEPAHAILAIRGALIATGLFLPAERPEDDFVPHLTLTEFWANPDGALAAGRAAGLEGSTFQWSDVAWVVPDSDFRFGVRHRFRVGSARTLGRHGRSSAHRVPG